MDRKLIQLPGGDWIDPTLVLGVTAIPKQLLKDPAGNRLVAPPCVHVTLQTGDTLIEPAGSFEGAEKLRDDIARAVNHTINPLLSEPSEE